MVVKPIKQPFFQKYTFPFKASGMLKSVEERTRKLILTHKKMLKTQHQKYTIPIFDIFCCIKMG